MKFFDYTIDIHGATIIAARDRLSTASLYDKEIDQQVLVLKADLDRVANKMKAAIIKQANTSLFSGKDA